MTQICGAAGSSEHGQSSGTAVEHADVRIGSPDAQSRYDTTRTPFISSLAGHTPTTTASVFAELGRHVQLSY